MGWFRCHVRVILQNIATVNARKYIHFGISGRNCGLSTRRPRERMVCVSVVRSCTPNDAPRNPPDGTLIATYDVFSPSLFFRKFRIRIFVRRSRSTDHGGAIDRITRRHRAPVFILNHANSAVRCAILIGPCNRFVLVLRRRVVARGLSKTIFRLFLTREK